ncbi:helitron helicase-like domain-containing protein [Paenibacillus elgii]|uniref:helitron helicase-like domain-containing protein n=1 Tax=Paenibacillus elgii TaxID=189691 RepID=UPI00203C2982|nr:helitron helicase-like domain-containing protein [Paenibacillus elgii]MCM3274326.1 helitron helicase-like domain-containing protein [Paenibacillus elgii]
MNGATSAVSTAYKKVIISGNVIEVYEYEKAPYQVWDKQDRHESDIEWINELEEQAELKLKEEQQAKSLQDIGCLSEEWREVVLLSGRYSSSITRTRNMVRRLILSNFDNGSKFVTFTFDDKKVPPEINTDVQASNKFWHAFIKRMRRKYGNFKYIVVIEFQKRGAVHYHMLSDLPYVKAKTLEEIWGNGFIKINRITHVDNVGAYVIKYMTKDLTDIRLYKNKAYSCSKGLERPTILRGELAEQIVLIYDFAQKKEVFTSSYTSEYLGKVIYREYNLKRL